jgi:hypothetical protein
MIAAASVRFCAATQHNKHLLAAPATQLAHILGPCVSAAGGLCTDVLGMAKQQFNRLSLLASAATPCVTAQCRCSCIPYYGMCVYISTNGIYICYTCAHIHIHMPTHAHLAHELRRCAGCFCGVLGVVQLSQHTLQLNLCSLGDILCCLLGCCGSLEVQCQVSSRLLQLQVLVLQARNTWDGRSLQYPACIL